MAMRIETRPAGRRWRGISQLMKLYLFASVASATFLPILLTWRGYQPLQTLMAILLLSVCLYPTARYYARRESGLPTMPILCGAYALQFAVPFFTNSPTILLADGASKYLSDMDVSAALLMSIVGVGAMQAGYYWFKQSGFRNVAPVAQLHLIKPKAVLYCVVAGIFLPLLFTFEGVIFPESLQTPLSSVLRLVANQVLVAIGVVGWIVYGCKGSGWYKVWLYVLVVLTVVRGISSGSLETALVPIGVLFFVKWVHTRRIAAVPILATVAMILFLSPVKGDYREQIWLGAAPYGADMTSSQKAMFWIEQASDYWGDTFSGNRSLTEATAGAVGRTDFIHQVAHIHSMTPSVIPYQNGETYSYFLVSFIPRILWPDKPLTGTANAFYAVTYGITDEEGARTTTFGVSLLGEAFINFGWIGVVLIMLLQGLIISILEHIFGGLKSGPGGQAVFIAFFVFFLNGIGSSAEILFGNILQNLICGYFVLRWARQKYAPVRRFRRPIAFELES